jgi:hypothetical protein
LKVRQYARSAPPGKTRSAQEESQGSFRRMSDVTGITA